MNLFNTEFGVIIKHVAQHAYQLSMRSAYTALLTRTA